MNRIILSRKHYIYVKDAWAWADMEDVLGPYFVNCRGLEKCIFLLEAAQRYWTESKYHDVRWTEERENVHKVGGKPNKPHLCPPSRELGKLVRGEYNKLLLDKRREMLELKINEDKIKLSIF